MQSKKPFIPERILQRLAIIMAIACVRNTIIEEYHARGSLSQDDMKAFNKEVANKLYTWLHIYYEGDKEDILGLAEISKFCGGHDWDEPKIDEGIIKFIEAVKNGNT